MIEQTTYIIAIILVFIGLPAILFYLSNPIADLVVIISNINFYNLLKVVKEKKRKK